MRLRPALLILTTLLITGCGGTESEPAATPETEETPTPEQSAAPDTPQAFIDALDAAMVREGQVLHTTVTTTGGEAGGESQDLWTDELWIYGAEDQARNHFHIEPENGEEQSPQTIFLIDGNQTYSKSSNGQINASEGLPARTCPLVESTQIIHQIVGLFCARFTPQEGEVNEIQGRVDANTEFEGTGAVALVYEAHNELEPNATPEVERAPDLTVSRFYVDDETFLPLGWTVEMQGEPTDLQLEITAVYSSQFIPRERLPDDFFDPAAIDQPTETTP